MARTRQHRRPKRRGKLKLRLKRGALHRQLGIPRGRKIPLHRLRWAAKQSGVLGRRARFALNARKWRRAR